MLCMNSDPDGKLNFGFIAQDVEESLFDNGYTEKDFAALSKEPIMQERPDGLTGYKYSLGYTQFIL